MNWHRRAAAKELAWQTEAENPSHLVGMAFANAFSRCTSIYTEVTSVYQEAISTVEKE
jgi:hypothetical protein